MRHADVVTLSREDIKEAVREELNSLPALRPKPSRKIMLAVPCHSGKPDYATVVSCANAVDEGARRGWEVVMVMRAGDSVLPRCRDVLVSMFWESDCDDMLFVDSDISWEPGVFTKIMSHECDKHGNPIEVIGGIYCGRGDPPNYVCVPLDTGNLDVDYPAGIAEIRGCGTGFLRITRAAVKRLIDALPDNHWYEDKFTAKGIKIWHFFDFTFDPIQDPGMRLRSEDYVFCDRFRAAGGKVWADVELTLHHAGMHSWRGHFGEFLRKGGSGKVIEGGTPGDLSSNAPAALASGLSLADTVERMIAAEARA
jgi:hypothetical protein